MTRHRTVSVAIGILLALAPSVPRAQDISPGPSNLPGLARAFGEIGQNILGDSIFRVAPGPPDAPSLDVWVGDATAVQVHLNIFRTNPGPPTTWARLTIEGGVVALRQDPRIDAPAVELIYGADLSTFTPPNPIAEINPGPPDFPAGLARALAAVGQNIMGARRFLSAKTDPGPPNSAALEVWVAAAAALPVNVHVFAGVAPGPPETWLRVTVANGRVIVQQDTTVRRSALVVDYSADLSAFLPPSPIVPREQ